MSDYQDDEEELNISLPEISRLYKTKYVIYGRNRKELLEMCSCVIAKDVTEIVDCLRKRLLGIELNGKGDDGEPYYMTVDAIEMINCEMIAPIHGMTDQSFSDIKAAYESKNLFPLVHDDDEAEEDEDEE